MFFFKTMRNNLSEKKNEKAAKTFKKTKNK
jgi:hypothetical protein